jgi:hypothetical protein
MKMASNWNGLAILERKDRACSRALISIATQVAMETKTVTHVISGTLRRSVHAAPAGYAPDEEREEQDATPEQNDLTIMYPLAIEEVPTEAGLTLCEVGSWLPYACAEWVGRGHPGVTQGLELARARTDATVFAAFASEGLT